MANTTNFGWETPDDTDLVKDGAAAIRTLGSAIDTSLVDLKGGTTGQVLAKASDTDMDFTWSSVDPLTILDAKGDLITATAADTPARLAVGANGTVLTADSAESSGLKWAAVNGWNPNFQLLNTGGTALTGAATITVSGISGKSALFIRVTGASSANASAAISIRVNGDTGSTNYPWAYVAERNAAIYSDQSEGSDYLYFANMGNSSTNVVNGYAYLYGTNTAGIKPYIWAANANGTTTDQAPSGVGAYLGTSAVTSISLVSSNGNFDAGTLYVYGA